MKGPICEQRDQVKTLKQQMEGESSMQLFFAFTAIF